MSKIPTVEIFFKDELKLIREEFPAIAHDFKLKALEFAKLHVKAALKAASENATAFNKAKFKGDCNPIVDEDSIINAYPLTNIT